MSNIASNPSHYEQIADVLRNDMLPPPKKVFNPYMEIDIAVDEGRTEDAKQIYKKYNVKPSLYAKQMALVNGFPATNLWVDTIGVRNQTGIDTVHEICTKDNGFQWSSAIPEQFRFS
jgi:hypothetical protein